MPKRARTIYVVDVAGDIGTEFWTDSKSAHEHAESLIQTGAEITVREYVLFKVTQATDMGEGGDDA